jgi:hypothetical protein
MSSRVGFQHFVSTSEPTAVTVGDEWYNPATGILYKRIVTSAGTVQWTSLSGLGGSSSSASTASTVFTVTNTTESSSAATGAIVISGGAGIAKNLYVGSNTYVSSSVYAVGDVVTNFSDERLKEIVGPINNALEKVSAIDAFYYVPNDLAKSIGIQDDGKVKIGLGAGSVKKVLPEVVLPSPVDPQYDTVQYERVVPLLVEAIKVLTNKIQVLEDRANGIHSG